MQKRTSLFLYVFRSHAMESSLQLCTAIRYFAQCGYLPVIGDLHGLSDRAASKCIHSVASVLCDNIENFIQWPSQNQIPIIQQKFYRKSRGFPKIVGLIDGTQVPINGPHPPANEVAFVNRKGFHGLNCQVVCDSEMKIIFFGFQLARVKP